MNSVRSGFWVLVLALAPSLATADVDAGWRYVTTDDGVVVYQKNVPGSDLVAFRGVTYADLEMGTLLAVFKNPAERAYWVDRYHSHTTFERGPDSETYRIRFGLPWPVSDRDYVLTSTGTIDVKTRTYFANIKSVEHPKAPEDDCCVRATVHGTYYSFTAVEGESKTKIVVEVHTDPKGAIPGWLVNLIQKSWPAKTLNGLIQHTKARRPTPLEEFRGWHRSP